MRPQVTFFGTKPVRAKLVKDGEGRIPVLSFAPFLEGIFDIQVQGTPVEAAAWLRQLAETASDLAIRVERHAAQVEAMATYPEAVA